MTSAVETTGMLGFYPPNDRHMTARSGTLRILATSDLHVHITPWDYYHDRRNAGVGLARTASLIRAARAEVACSLLVDNGDFLQGSPLGDMIFAGGTAPFARPHPMIAAMNALGYDAAALGNHEFSHGMEFLLNAIASARFPVLSANLALSLGATPLDDWRLVPATALLTRSLTDAAGRKASLTIGVIGFAPPQTVLWEQQSLGNSLKARDILEAAAAHVPQLRAAGADIVIALSHSGIGAGQAAPGMENASAALAALPGIDALIAGHTHQTFPAPDYPPGLGIDPVNGLLWGKPAVMPGFHGSHLGVIDLDLERHDDKWRVASSHCELRPIAQRGPTGKLAPLTRSAPQIQGIAAPAHRATTAWSKGVIGRSDQPLHSYFAMIAPADTVRLVARAQADHVAEVLRGTAEARLPIVSAAAPFHAGGRGGPENYTFVEAGPLTMRHAFDLYPHPNMIAALRVSGDELRLWLERSFSQFFQMRPGAQDAPLIDPDFPSFNFDTVEGLTWTVDLAQPAPFDSHGTLKAPALRIQNLKHRGKPVAPQQSFVLATNSYRAGGGGHFPGTTPDRILFSGLKTSRDTLIALAARHATLPRPGPANWQFRPMPGTTALFQSAPAASTFAADVAGRRLEPLGLEPSGFRRFRLHL